MLVMDCFEEDYYKCHKCPKFLARLQSDVLSAKVGYER